MWVSVDGFAFGVCKGCTSRVVFFSNTVWKVWSPAKKSSLRSFFTCMIFDLWRCKIKLCCKCVPSLPFMLLQYHGIKKQRRQRLRESEAFCHSTSPIPKQQRLTASTNTLEINYLWNRVRASLIFSFYPIKLSNHSKPLYLTVLL